MTEQNPYPAQVADLINQAFATLGEGLEREAQAERDEFLEEAKLRMAAAQAIAALAHAHETRALALATLAGLDPVQVDQAGDLPREALIAAARALSLVDEDDAPAEDDAAIERMIADGLLASGDPADADLGDLK